MGAGEKDMRTWAYAACGMGLGLAVLSLVICSLTLVVLGGNVSLEIRDNTRTIAIIGIIVAVATGIVSGVAISRIWKDHQLYLKAMTRVATQSQTQAKPSTPITTPSKPPVTNAPATAALPANPFV